MTMKKMYFENSSEQFRELPIENQNTILHWIEKNLCPCKTPMYRATSYWLKHALERDTGFYCTNDQFKSAMLKCGYKPVNPTALNWYFCISRRSPAFQHNDKPCV